MPLNEPTSNNRKCAWKPSFSRIATISPSKKKITAEARSNAEKGFPLRHFVPLWLTFTTIVAALSLLTLFGCGKSAIKADLSTPEGAILLLEDAYRQGDIEKAVACKDFKVEAAHMTRDKPGFDTPEATAKIAEALELAYRAEMKHGFPDVKGVTSTFPKKRNYSEGKVVVTEVCRYPDGGTSKQNILVAKTEGGWKVMIPIK